MPNKDGVVVFTNITKYCNMNCPRCYLTEESRATRHLLDIDSLCNFLGHQSFEDLPMTVIWQGGEVTTLGKDVFISYINAINQLNPLITQRAITNFLSLPSWFIETMKQACDNKIETTFALGNKFTLAGDSERYTSLFIENAKKAISQGLDVSVNVELNKETFSKGPEALLTIANETKVVAWEFDYSVDFETFLRNPIYNRFGYPVLPTTITHAQFADYIKELKSLLEGKYADLPFNSSILDLCFKNQECRSFNVKKEMEFFTINPNGTITTNPLFSDLAGTFLGNIEHNDANEILQMPERLIRAQYEKHRTVICGDCERLAICKGGPSHIGVHDESGECVGLKQMITGGSACAE